MYDTQSAVRAKKQMVTEAEREMLRSGKFDELVEEQRRIDAEKDAEVHVYTMYDVYMHVSASWVKNLIWGITLCKKWKCGQQKHVLTQC